MTPGKTNRYAVLLVDLVGSQEMEDREEATRKFKRSIRDFNAANSDMTVSEMEITRGDEAAVVMTRIDRLYDMVTAFIGCMKPIGCRFVVTYGEFTAGLKSRRSTEIDGPAFYRADAAMRELKHTTGWFRLETGHAARDGGITALVNLILLQKDQMTDFQSNVAELYASGKTQSEVARKLKRTQQQVSQAVRAVRFDLLRDADLAVRGMLGELQAMISGGGPDA